MADDAGDPSLAQHLGGNQNSQDDDGALMIGNIIINDAVIRKYATSQDERPSSKSKIADTEIQVFRHQPSFSRVSESPTQKEFISYLKARAKQKALGQVRQSDFPPSFWFNQFERKNNHALKKNLGHLKGKCHIYGSENE